MTEVIKIERKVLEKNDAIAAANRARFAEHGLTVLNIVSSPGAGKTTLLERTLERLNGRLRIAVIEGDVQTDLDARRVARYGVPVVQIVTNGGCHLEANLVQRALDRLDLDGLDLLIIENVGNLVCPANYDLGEAMKVVVLSTTEGDDKPLKYPAMFRNASVLVDQQDRTCCRTWAPISRRSDDTRAQINPDLQVFETSCTTGAGLDDWCQWLESSGARVSCASACAWRCAARCRASASGRSSTGSPASSSSTAGCSTRRRACSSKSRVRAIGSSDSSLNWARSVRRSPSSRASSRRGWIPCPTTRFEIRESARRRRADRAGAARHRDLRRLPPRAVRSGESPLSLSLHQLHELRAALQRSSTRCRTTAPERRCARSRCVRRAGTSTTIRSIADSTRSRMRVRSADRSLSCGTAADWPWLRATRPCAQPRTPSAPAGSWPSKGWAGSI